MRIGITGANGCLGGEILAQLIEHGHGVKLRAMFRHANAKSAALEAKGVEVVLGSLEDPTALEAFTLGLDQIVHCAALTKESEGWNQLRRVNVDGTRCLAYTAMKAGVRHFLHVSTAAVYGEKEGEYPESTPLSFAALKTRYSVTKLEAENVLMEVRKAGNMRVTLVRPTVIFGPGSSWTIDPLHAIARGLPLSPRGDTVGDFVWVGDVARAIRSCMERPSSWGLEYNLAGVRAPWKEYFRLYGQLLGKKVRSLPRTFDWLCRFIPALRLYRQVVSEARSYPSDRARAFLSYQPSVDFLEAFDLLENWLRRSPHLSSKWKPRFQFKLRSQTFLEFSPRRVVRPTSESEIRRIIEYAREKGRKIRTRGAMHSFAPLYVTEDILVDLREFSGVLEIAERFVRVRGGTALTDLMRALSKCGKSLATHGAIKTQTVAGATSTGTHGCSRDHGSLSSKILELVLLDGTGRKRVIGADSAELDLVRIGLGSLGIVLEVVLAIEDAIFVEEVTEPGNLVELQAPGAIQKRLEGEEYSLLLLYPRIRSFVHTCYRRLPVPPASVVHKRRNVGAAEIYAGKIVLPWIASDGILGKGLRHFQRRSVNRVPKRCAGELAGILATDKPRGSREYPAWDVALAIPWGQAETALKALLQFLYPVEGASLGFRAYLAPMVQLRPQGEETCALGATRDGRRIWFELWVDQRIPTAMWKEFLNDLHELLEDFDYRVHWGKNTPMQRKHLERVYPELETFRAFRDTVDPDRLFESAHLNFLEKQEQSYVD